MTAEAIAKVVTDVRHERVLNPNYPFIPDLPQIEEARRDLRKHHHDLIATTAAAAIDAPVVDVTAVFDQIMADHRQVDLYADHKAAPPWVTALLSYVNEHGNVHILHLLSVDKEDSEDWEGLNRWETENPVDWDRVRWVLDVSLFIGGRGKNNTVYVETVGPMYAWQIAVYPDGALADIHWFEMFKHGNGADIHTNPMLVLLRTLDMLNSVNVHVCEPDRPRAQARRLERTGIRISEIHIRPLSRSYKGKGTPLSADLPLHGVRGHPVLFGPKYGRGLLFGKYEGRYWVRPHQRGNPGSGTSEQRYVVEP